MALGRRPTIEDLAQEAKVSVATVDRVLNRRLKVREETAQRVYDAARAIGYHASALIKQRMHTELPALTFGFLLRHSSHPFYQSFSNHLQQAVEKQSTVRGRAIIEHVDDDSIDTVLEKLEPLSQQADSIALVSPDNYRVTELVRSIRSSGKPVFSVLSDFALGVRDHYIGLNNLKVGRTAAWLVSRTALKPGKIALFVGGFRWHGHELRELGFRSYFREFAPEFEVLETFVNLEEQDITEEVTRELLQCNPDLSGIYVAGGGMEGAIAALREIRSNPLPAVVVNELTRDSSTALSDHMIVGAISTPLAELSSTLVDMMVSAKTTGPSDNHGQLLLPFNLHVPESV